MKKCDGSRDYKERKENRCNKDSQCGGANQDGPKCQTKNCNYCTDGKTGAKCWGDYNWPDPSECADGYICENEKCREPLSLGCGEKCNRGSIGLDADCASGDCHYWREGGFQYWNCQC